MKSFLIRVRDSFSFFFLFSPSFFTSFFLGLFLFSLSHGLGKRESHGLGKGESHGLGKGRVAGRWEYIRYCTCTCTRYTYSTRIYSTYSVCMYACMHVCVRACVRACMYGGWRMEDRGWENGGFERRIVVLAYHFLVSFFSFSSGTLGSIPSKYIQYIHSLFLGDFSLLHCFAPLPPLFFWLHSDAKILFFHTHPSIHPLTHPPAPPFFFAPNVHARHPHHHPSAPDPA